MSVRPETYRGSREGVKDINPKVKTELALAEQRRRNRRARDEQDHYERTRHSLIYEGHELWYVKPTAQTQAKLRQDPLVRLVAHETLTKEQGRAGLEIRHVYFAVVSALLPRAAPMERISHSRSLLDSRVDVLHARNYLPWARYLGGDPERRAKGRCPIALVVAIDVLIDGATLSRADALHGLRHGTSGRLLDYALLVYVDLAGWERNRGRIAAFEAAGAMARNF